ncbi:hypothetical protein V4C53_43530 [Paraburkholderia azotifigens]|uniref:hypothetical protein n=1 Tax=Paraburkholderia azotifigens TaxID=2057004 RepID=UPI00317B78CC
MSDYFSLNLPLCRHRCLDDESPQQVTYASPVGLRQALETLARYFKRELGFDFMQYGADETPASKGYIPYEAYLFYEPAYDRQTHWDQRLSQRIFGACCFRQRQTDGRDASWSLDWAWMHPYFRRRQHLTRAWITFEQRYGAGFHVEPPLSLGMEAFLNAMNQR